MLKEHRLKLLHALNECNIHLKRLAFAREMIRPLIPLKPETYEKIEEDNISYIDQLIYRFTKLQDTMGDSLFPSILKSLEEDPEQMSMLDILNRLEKLNILTSAEEWIRLRNLRNEFTHEYEDNMEENSKLVNSLFNEVNTIYTMFVKIKHYILKNIFPYIPAEELNNFDFKTPEIN